MRDSIVYIITYTLNSTGQRIKEMYLERIRAYVRYDELKNSPDISSVTLKLK